MLGKRSAELAVMQFCSAGRVPVMILECKYTAHGSSGSGRAVQGFTLIELIVVLLLTGLLAVVALPRMLDDKAFQSRGFRDATMATLRLAQKSAIAERRTTCVAFEPNSVSVTLRSVAGNSACAYAVGAGEVGLGPGGDPYVVTATAGITFTTTPTNFSFSPLGRASVSNTISINGETNIVVEAESGYVHSP